MKYKKGDDIYLKGRITDVSSCSEASFPYEVDTADEFISAREEDIASVNEPEKPVIPLYVADWLEVCKDNLALSLANSVNNIVMRANNQPDKTIHWIAKSSETFAKAWLFGYEVEKDKLYTVFQVATEEYLYTNGVGKLSSVHVSYAFVEEHEEYHFTQQKLEELNYWENPAFEIKEVKK